MDYRGPEDADGKLIYEKLGANSTDQTIGEIVKKISRAPLVHQPRTMWEYGLSMDVLARLVEVVSGKPYDKFLEERIFKPLSMIDTGYNVPSEKQGRLAKLSAPAEGGSIKLRWFEYFKHSHKTTFKPLDGWIRRRLRTILRRPKRQRGEAKTMPDHIRWPNAYFEEQGLITLESAFVEARQSSMR